MKIILAYSGGLDTSVLVHWYANEQNAEVITYCADVGQEEELDGLEEKALSTGATAHRTRTWWMSLPTTSFIRWFGGMPFTNPNTSSAPRSPALLSPRRRSRWPGNSSQCSRPRGNRQRKRPMQIRTHIFRPRPGLANSRSLEGCIVQGEISRTQGNDRVLRRAQDRRGGKRLQTLLHGPEPLAHFIRGRHFGGSLV